ncbi:hypothetical protein [Mesorhizobium abyssinicae]|uniref:hypothetical protein n=1 Tax=Mesorhizobium abyssinicae TaxID=1209958 RepID=UPI0033964D4D
MAGMTPSEFLEGFAQEDYWEWEQSKGSLRAAFHAAISASHLADHYYRFHARMNPHKVASFPTFNHFLEHLKTACPPFKVIRDMANAYKHLYTKASCDVASGGSVHRVTASGEIFDTEWSDETGSRIVIRHRDGQLTDFGPAITQVNEMWWQLTMEE